MSSFSEDSGSALWLRLGKGVLLRHKCFSAIVLKLVKTSSLQQVPPAFHLMKSILVSSQHMLTNRQCWSF